MSIWRYTNGKVVRISGTATAPPAPAFSGTLTGSYTASTASTGTLSAWSATNLPWQDLTEAQYLATLPLAVPKIVDLPTGGADFYANVKAVHDANSVPIVVRLPAGVFHLTEFRKTLPTVSAVNAFGMWLARLRGFIGAGPSNTFIQMDANSIMPAGALDYMSQMTTVSNEELPMGFMRLDGVAANAASPVTLAGLTFRGADQVPLTAVGSDSTFGAVPAVVPQPAPYNGIAIFPGSFYQVSHVRFQAAAHAMTSRGPFELGNVKSQKAFGSMHNVESDGRLSPAINLSQPRRCTVVMLNDEGSHELTDFWGHHSNVSRYAANDQQQTYGTKGKYSTTRCRFDHIADLQNTDPAQNNGVSLNGYSDPSCMGWESCSASIVLNDPYLQNDNPNQTRNNPLHISLTTTAGNVVGGTITINRGTFRNFGHPIADNYLAMKIATTTAWYQSGLANTVFAYNAAGTRKTPILVTAWPPTSGQLAGTSGDTHYLVKTN